MLDLDRIRDYFQLSDTAIEKIAQAFYVPRLHKNHPIIAGKTTDHHPLTKGCQQ
jgi:hypothetical protein